MKAYFFVNSALSGIQKGLQIAHCVAEMGNKVAKEDVSPEDISAVGFAQRSWYFNWARDHKTIIVLEGGFHADLMAIHNLFTDAAEVPLIPVWAAFSEDEETMNGMMTCVGIILPERIYEVAKWTREKTAILRKDSPEEEGWRLFGERSSEWNPYTNWEVELIKLINSCPLAR